MAAVMYVRNGRGGSTRTTKGLLLICTLFSLVCFTRSHFDKEQLKQLKETQQYLKRQLQEVKEEHKSTVKPYVQLMNYYGTAMDSVIDVMKNHMGELPDDFPPLEQFLNNAKDFLEKSKAYVEKKDTELDGKIKDLEEAMRQSGAFIKLWEELHAEL